MRLTLRTLLAYLDNTLDPKDAEALREKLAESGFATQLVQRIRATLVSRTLSAPSPDAVSPLDEANVISEYLDSTLSAEQIAEVEKACLESDTHLAEAAACHQILTMVLGQPANVSEALRDRVYQLPDRLIQEIPTAASGSFSGVSLPDQAGLSPEGSGFGASPPVESVLESSIGPVKPVGAGDSGVSDAPQRLREAEVSESHRRARATAEDMYGGSIRPSRITPWLVSLALAGVFLFALSRVLAPLMTGPIAQNEEKLGTIGADGKRTNVVVDDPTFDTDVSEDESVQSAADDIEVSAANAPIMETVGTPGVEIKSTDETEITELPLPAPKPDPETVAVDTAPEMTELPAGDETTLPSKTPDTVMEIAMATPPTAKELADEKMASPEAVTAADKTADAPDASAPDGAPAVTDPALNNPALNPADDKAVAKAVSGRTILLATGTANEAFANANWTRVEKDMSISPRATLINAPKFRSELVINTEAKVTFVGPTKASFLAARNDKQTAGLKLEYGKVLIRSKKDDVVMPFQVMGRDIELQFPTADSVAAIEVIWLRRPGFDPFKPENHVPVARIVAVADPAGLASEFVVASAEGDEKLLADQQWMARGDDAPKVSDLIEPLVWATEDTESSILDQSARKGLMDLLAQQQPLALSLREATSFRQAEVAALAAQLMLHLGQPDVYFGTDGILSQPKQRSYWTEHFGELRNAMNRDATSATLLNDQIAQMDSANAKNLMRLLIGFSQSQLVESADDDLIEMLDSNSMPVRVLATENLREITGTTLNFWAGEDNAVRRVPAIKKWQVRLRKGDIRWKTE
ncbi:hypothetical protein [Planctomycetes bacterium K23_9]|uniref:Uncharacterized protein n=1 Tax=Stieleria marina TaxID=1930275 RepID=A0A517NTD8_9BACT|nr:hypothetical protein K239x_23520 [Planctomycetes bacterium K23_9]